MINFTVEFILQKNRPKSKCGAF